jgi:hypothetical protein
VLTLCPEHHHARSARLSQGGGQAVHAAPQLVEHRRVEGVASSLTGQDQVCDWADRLQPYALRRHARSPIAVTDVSPPWQAKGVVTVDDVRAVVAGLPRSYEVLVRDRIKFRVGSIVYVAFSRDEETMGFGFPKEERSAMVASRPDVFEMPPDSDLRFNWIVARLNALDVAEMRELVLAAWVGVVPKRVAAAHFAAQGDVDG